MDKKTTQNSFTVAAVVMGSKLNVVIVAVSEQEITDNKCVIK
jgi:hypothetical protein